MKLFKTTLLVLVFVFGASCDRNAGDKPQNSIPPPVVEGTEAQAEAELNTEDEEAQDTLEVKDTIVTDENQVQNEPLKSEPQVEEPTTDTGNTDQNSGWNWWMIGAIVSIVINFVLGYFLYQTIDDNCQLEKGKEHYKRENKRFATQLREIRENNTTIKHENQKLKNRNTSKRKYQPDEKRVQKSTYDDQKSPEILWSMNNAAANPPQQEVKQPIHLFAEKATEDSTFSSVSDQKNEHRTIFKCFRSKK